MPKPEKNAMALVDACRSPIRRKIMILAEEAHAAEETVTAKGLSDKLGRPLSNVSYYVAALAKAGALETVGGSQKRGAWQKTYAPSKAFQATMTDTVALDQIAELMDEGLPKNQGIQNFREDQFFRALKIVRATGRPVEA